MSEGRQAEIPAFFKKQFGETVEVMVDQSAANRMLGKIGLNHDLTRRVATTGAASDLLEHGEEPLGGAEVPTVESIIRAQHSDQRQLWKVVTLGDHLRAHQDVDCSFHDLLSHA